MTKQFFQATTRYQSYMFGLAVMLLGYLSLDIYHSKVVTTTQKNVNIVKKFPVILKRNILQYDHDIVNAILVRLFCDCDIEQITWNQVGTDFDDQEGVAISNDGARVGVRDGALLRIYELNGDDPDGSWLLIGDFIFSNDEIRVALSSDGSKVIIGDPQLYNNGTQTGGVLVFQQLSESNWTQMGQTIVRGIGSSYSVPLGICVGITDDGTRIVASAVDRYYGSNGYIKVLDWDGSDWDIQSTIAEPIPANEFGSDFGDSLALAQDRTKMVVGAPQYTPAYDSVSGAVFIYDLKEFNLIDKFLGDNAGSIDISHSFGDSVSISSDGSRFAATAWEGRKSYTKVFQFNSTTGSYYQIGDNICGRHSLPDTCRYDRYCPESLTSNGDRLYIGSYVYQITDETWTLIGENVDTDNRNSLMLNEFSKDGSYAIKTNRTMNGSIVKVYQQSSDIIMF